MANFSKNMKALTSLDFVEFTSKRSGSTNLPEGAEKLVVEIKSVEQELIEALKKKNKNERNKDENVRFYRIYLRLGHINLLAEDFPKALSAYQKSYKSNKDEFWKDPAALYGLAITYYHFRAYNPAIELFCQLLFSHPYCEANTEVHARLGLSFKSLENYSQALKHLNIALDHAKECPVLPKSFLRFQVAHCLDIAGEIRKAVEEYRRLLADHDRGIVPLSNQLLAAIYSRLGWISLYSREREPKEEVRLQKLKEAEALLLRARELCSVDSKANQYLGLCYSEQTRVANKLLESGVAGSGDQQQSAQQQGNGQQQHPRYNADQAAQNAFISYRTAIDSDESDANTWRSIGILYQQQNQPFDALQAFACAVQLNDKHYAAWSNLGQLYEKYRQYKETLFCYKKALQANPESPEQLRLRIAVIEKELSQIGGPANYSLLAQQQLARRGDTTSSLHPIESAWQLDIPAQVRQRLAEHKKQQENKYREGSPLFNMHDLIASSMAIDADDRSLTPTQRQILQILKLNKDQLEMHETTLLRELEQRVADEEPGQEGSGNEMAGEKHAGDDESSVKSAQQHQSQRQQMALDQKSLGDAHYPPSTSKSNQPPNASTSSASSADPAITNLVFPSSMLSPKEEPQQEELAKSAAAAAIAATETANGQQIQEEKISSTSQHPHELPPQFSLLAPVNMPITVTSSEVLEMCKKRCAKPEEYKPIFDENVPPPKPPAPPAQSLAKEKLLLKTPVILVENQRDAMSMELQQFCYNQPIVLIHGLTMALKIDLSQFSTKTLIQTAADHEVEVRTQFKMPYDVNVDQMGNPTWFCKSSKSFTTISRYGQYQAESFKHSLKEETEKLRQTNPKLYGPVEPQTPLPDGSSPVPTKKRKTAAGSATRMGTPTRPNGAGNEENNPYKMIKFGTNIDLSDEKKFYFQLRELNKLPPFCRLSSASNMLSYLGHTVLGMNTVQLYLKVPGCRTPGHLENNSFASVNVNIGPGECEWFGVPYEYWPTIERMCKERGIDFLRGAWWPHVADLVGADVPFYRFTQRAGDCVFVNGGCVHWVQSTGWCNNVAWNVGPMTANQMEMALTAHEWNRLNSYQSLVPMQHLCWSLARDVRFSNQKLYNQVKNMLIRSLAYCQMLVDFVGVAMKSPIKKQQRQKGECAYFCHLCEIEVFNLLFVKEIGGRWKIFCVQCARQNNLDDYVVLQQYTFEELQLIFDRFQLHPAKSSLIC